VVSQEPVYAIDGQVKQESAAINYKNPDTVVISEARWNGIHNEAIKQALALHELTSLAGIEATGKYPVSGRFLESSGVPCNVDLCTAPPTPPPGAFGFESAEKAFESGVTPAPNEIDGTWLNIGLTKLPELIPDDIFGMGPDGYYVDGVFSKDKNIEKLIFADTKDLFSGNTTDTVVLKYYSPTLENHPLYSSEGPFKTSFTATGLCFGIIAWNRSTNQPDTSLAHFNKRCKLVKNGALLLCEESFNASREQTVSFARPYLGKVVAYELFRKE